MAAIVLRGFGGMAPSANPKTLAEGMGTYAHNLDLRHGDFRPLPEPADMGVPMTPGLTLYRFENSGWFITNPNVVNYVRGPIANDATERTYYTGDGVPKVVNQFNDVRQLGVPQPAAAPTVTVNETDEFTTEDSRALMPGKQEEVVRCMWDNLVTTHTGLSDADLAAAGFVATADPWRFRFAIAGTLAAGAFTPASQSHRVLMSDKLGFYLETVGATTTGYVDVSLRGLKYHFDASFVPDLEAINDPIGEPLMTEEVAQTIVNALAQPLTAMQTERDASSAKLKLYAREFYELGSTPSPSMSAGPGGMDEFYGQPIVDQQINAAIARAVKTVKDSIATYNKGSE